MVGGVVGLVGDQSTTHGPHLCLMWMLLAFFVVRRWTEWKIADLHRERNIAMSAAWATLLHLA